MGRLRQRRRSRYPPHRTTQKRRHHHALYQNTSGTFSDISAGLSGVSRGAVAWGDYDNDGDLDILLTGADSGYDPISRVYRNTSGTFSDISAGLTDVYHGYAAWGDYDNDGDLDVLLTGLEIFYTGNQKDSRGLRLYTETLAARLAISAQDSSG